MLRLVRALDVGVEEGLQMSRLGHDLHVLAELDADRQERLPLFHPGLVEPRARLLGLRDPCRHGQKHQSHTDLHVVQAGVLASIFAVVALPWLRFLCSRRSIPLRCSFGLANCNGNCCGRWYRLRLRLCLRLFHFGRAGAWHGQRNLLLHLQAPRLRAGHRHQILEGVLRERAEVAVLVRVLDRQAARGLPPELKAVCDDGTHRCHGLSGSRVGRQVDRKTPQVAAHRGLDDLLLLCADGEHHGHCSWT
mmetsp:Transcript_139653/g.446894  ORF Transcript_139653/g.446894 Transcript_139653/m.446894 type:complete len:249 (-) Transcript_139653:74-820(-)